MAQPLSTNLLANILALAAMVPAALLAVTRRENTRSSLEWPALILAAAGPSAWTIRQLAGHWDASISATLWAGIAASMIVFLLIAMLDRQSRRLTPLLMPYLLLLGLFASVFVSIEPGANETPPSSPWLDAHILISVITIALLTVASVAALGSFLQVRALKSKHPNRLSRMLPALADSERLALHLLIASEAVLALGLATGMATEYGETGRLLQPEHKIMLTLLAFVVIGLLLIGRRVCGVRGEIAARTALVAYLLVIVGYFGMKFIHQVLMA